MSKTLFKYTIETSERNQFIDIDSYLEDAIQKSQMTGGIVVVYCPHTTAGITINENADPDVKTDLIFGLKKAFPIRKEFQHREGNSDSHLKSSTVGASETIIVDNGRPIFGTWQSVYFAEFDGPRTRQLIIKCLKG